MVGRSNRISPTVFGIRLEPNDVLWPQPLPLFKSPQQAQDTRVVLRLNVSQVEYSSQLLGLLPALVSRISEYCRTGGRAFSFALSLIRGRVSCSYLSQLHAVRALNGGLPLEFLQISSALN
jgi:hypothetical protein